MPQRVFLVHGWSVQETITYQALHLKLAQYGDFTLEEIFLGRYVSLDDKVEIRDLAKALQNALDDKLAGNWHDPFHIITHSTGALVVRHWIARHYSDERCAAKPLRNLVFLAGPHFGSRLAHHGRSMLAHIRYLGDTGTQILKALELGSEYSWLLADAWLDPSSSLDPGTQLDNVPWQDKGIRPYCLIGDRVKRGKKIQDRFGPKLIPAGFEEGSDMVVRVPAGNLNFRRFRLMAEGNQLTELSRIEGVPFAAFAGYVHSGPEFGIMNSIKKRTERPRHLALDTILNCLAVDSDAAYADMLSACNDITAQTRIKRHGYAQLDFRFRDDEGHPITDYAFTLGWIDVGGEVKPSKAIRHVHKNQIHPHHFTVFLEVAEISQVGHYFVELTADSGTWMFSFNDFRVDVGANHALFSEFVKEDQTTQIDVVLSRTPSKNLFVFHRGNDPDLHVKWDRMGLIEKKGIGVE